MKRSAMTVAGLVAVGLLTAATYMSVSFNVTTGAGWVGKGDVQMAYGWANKAMQQNHTAVTFEYEQSTNYSWVCEWTTGEGTRGEQTHTKDMSETFSVGGVIGNTDRKTGQWTGWFLNGYTSGGPGNSGEGFTPDCNGNSTGNGASGEKTVVEGSLTSTVTGGGLYANFNGDRRPLTITPVL
jgi:hypothetical protein